MEGALCATVFLPKVEGGLLADDAAKRRKRRMNGDDLTWFRRRVS